MTVSARTSKSLAWNAASPASIASLQRLKLGLQQPTVAAAAAAAASQSWQAMISSSQHIEGYRQLLDLSRHADKTRGLGRMVDDALAAT
jgi:hypothetical protein